MDQPRGNGTVQRAVTLNTGGGLNRSAHRRAFSAASFSQKKKKHFFKKQAEKDFSLKNRQKTISPENRGRELFLTKKEEYCFSPKQDENYFSKEGGRYFSRNGEEGNTQIEKGIGGR